MFIFEVVMNLGNGDVVDKLTNLIEKAIIRPPILYLTLSLTNTHF